MENGDTDEDEEESEDSDDHEGHRCLPLTNICEQTQCESKKKSAADPDREHQKKREGEEDQGVPVWVERDHP